MSISESFVTPGHVRIRVDVEAGEVVVDATAAGETLVELAALRDDDATTAALAEATVTSRERDGGTEIVVQVPRRKGFSIRRSPSVAVRVRCPEGSDLEVSTASADVTARGRLGDVQANSASGDVRLEALGRLSANSASGDIAAAATAGGQVRTASGDVQIGRADGPLRVNLVSGDVEIGAATGDLSVASVSGDQEIGTVESGNVTLQSVSGDVHVGVRPGLRVWIDAVSVSGSMQSELDDADGPAAGGTAVTLKVRTVSGDLRIVRRVVVAG